jgi:ethanolamine ammonia-lyase small subunit
MGRAGGSLPTRQWLAFAADHADARDAVYSQLDLAGLSRNLNCPLVCLSSQATDRATYLLRPDLGRILSAASANLLEQQADDKVCDVTLILADGLSANATQRYGPECIGHLRVLFEQAGYTIGPICAVTQARVAIGDQIGSLLNASMSVILIGERPGLGIADSLGAYLTYAPAPGRSDADRNCVSNIHPRQLAPAAAAQTIFWLIQSALRRRLSGVALKDESMPIQSLQPFEA